MNILSQAYNYLDFIFKSTPVGFKALLYDQETLKFISVAMTKTELYKYEVYAVDEISSLIQRPNNSELDSFSCFCLLRPTSENINLLCRELDKPHFPKYNLYFTNLITDQQIRQLGSCDTNSLIQNLQEIYIDYSALGTRLFSFNLPNISDFRINPSLTSFSDRIAEGLYAAICSLRLRPIIRYDCNSSVTKSVADKLNELVQSNSELLSDYRNDNGLILILDRRNDPVSPLLHSFYFYSTVHDLLTIDNNLVKIGKDEIPIDERNDPETERIGAMYLGDAHDAIINRYDNLKKVRKDLETKKEQDLGEKAFIYQESSKEENFTNNNMSLATAFLAKIKSENLTSIASCEQIIATVSNARSQFGELRQMILDSKCTPENALRLALIFILHYEKSDSNLIPEVLSILSSKYQWTGNEMKYANTLLSISGQDKRTEDIFSNKSIFVEFINNVKSLKEKSKFEMFHPPLEKIIRYIKEGNLDQKRYPFVTKKSEPRKVIIFIIGGATYFEHMVCTQMSNKKSFDFILGGTTVHNAASFLKYEVDPFC